jgi:hypothetical protein
MMKYIRSLVASLLAVLAVAIVFQMIPAHADNANLDFTLVNRTGYGIKEIYIAPSASTDWGDNIIGKPLENGDELAITFSPKETAEHWDIRIVWVDEGADVIWKKCKLSEITKIMLHYNRDTDETTAETE